MVDGTDMSRGAFGAVHVLTDSLDPAPQLSALVNLIRWAHEDPVGRRFEVTSLRAGAATASVHALAPTTVVHDPHGWGLTRVLQRARLQRAAAFARSASLRRRLRVDGPVYLVGSGSARMLHWVGAAAHPVVTHLGSADPGVTELLPDDRQLVLRRTDRWICGNSDQADELVRLGVRADAIRQVPDVLPFSDVPVAGSRIVDEVREELCDRHEIPKHAPLVVGIGNVDWWDVPDVLPRVVWEVSRRSDASDVQFLWVPDGASDRSLWPLRHDIAHAGIGHRLHVVDDSRPVWHYVAAAQALLVTRLSGHVPAALLETAVLGRPIVGFEGATSMAGRPVGRLVTAPHLDIDGLVDRLLVSLRSGVQGSDGPGETDLVLGLPSLVGPVILDALTPLGRSDVGSEGGRPTW